MENRFDVIVIGSGIGGMTTASLLAQFFNKRVLVVERHSTFGGLTHEFSRGESSFEVGVHLIGDMEEGSDMRKIFDAVTGSMVKMQKLPNYYDTFIYPLIQLKVDSDPEQYKSDLVRLFPDEANAIKSYFKDVRSYMRLLTFMMMRDSVPAFFKPLLNVAEWIYTHLPNIRIKKYATTAEYLDRHFKSGKLKSLLASQWGYYGITPDQSAMLVHAVIVNHYLKGAWYPLHGPKKIGDAVADIIKQNNGQVILNNAVLKLIVKNNVAKGIVLTKPDADGNSEYYADAVVSNIGADLTYRKLLPASGINLTNKIQELKRLWIKDNFLSLYLTFKDSPAKLGFDGGNVWWFRYNDHRKGICSVYHRDFPAYLFISFPTLKGHTSKKHTVEVLSIVPYSDFESWASRPWFNRGEEYEKLKLKITDKIINEADRHYPGFKDMVDYAELATPLSIEHFTGRVNGSSYGLMTTPERYKIKWLNTTATPIKNLYLSGQDVVTPGIAGAMMGGLAAAGAAIGPGGFIKVMAAVKQASANRKFKSADNDYHLVITDIKDETPEAYSIFFNDEKGALKDHKPGQFIILSLDIDGKTEYRSYSLTNCPARNEAPSITIKKIKNGLVSSSLRDRLKIGDAVRIEGPYGKLTWKTTESNKNDYLMIAGGCGVTPIFSLIKTILKEEHNSTITFLYANREVNQIIFRDKLDLLADEYKGRFNISYYLSDERNPQVGSEGFITKTVLENTMKELKNPIFIFMCAPDVMMNLVEKYLKELSFPLKNLFIEKFSYKPFNLKVEDSVDATVHINVKGKSFDVQVPPGVFLLDSLISSKVPVKYSCREGHCGVCKVRLVKGTVNLIKNDFLSSNEIANGEILLCNSIATSEVIEIDA